MTTSYPVNSVSSTLAINQDLELQELMEKLKQAMVKEEAETAKLMAALKAILSELKGMMSTNTPISTDQIAEINGQVSALTDAFEKTENNEESKLNDLMGIGAILDAKALLVPSSHVSLEEVKAIQRFCDELKQKIAHEKKEFSDLVGMIEGTLQALKNGKPK